MGLELESETAGTLARLAREGGLSKTNWVRGAVNAADADPEVAQRIVEVAPPSKRGGFRIGAGRPRGSENKRTKENHE